MGRRPESNACSCNNMKFYNLLINTSVLLAILVCPISSFASDRSDALDQNNKEYLAQYEEAIQAQKRANAVNGEWREVNKLIEDSHLEYKNGDVEKALELIIEAKHQAELGYQQAVSQQGKVEHPSYLK